MPDPTALLSIEGLRSGYGGKPVLQGVDLAVRDRQITAVIGRNGVGKSTLMKTVIGLLPATTAPCGSTATKSPGKRRMRAPVAASAMSRKGATCFRA